MTIRRFFLSILALSYQHVVKRILFLTDAEKVHNRMTATGEILGKTSTAKKVLAAIFRLKDPALTQTVARITFENPIGLSAGFDYEGRLTQILPSVGFGFQTVGTITHKPYNGNPRPMLGRLPRSKSLMVNKGFKNRGAQWTANHLSEQRFSIPIGISIGRTNSLALKTQKESIADIIQAFTIFERSQTKHSYYELNISCPNLYGNITFYPSKNLKELLAEVDKLRLTRPVFIKMPIEKSNAEVEKMLDVISTFSPAGVIFGNLQKDRTNPAFDQEEVKKFPTGNFSGRPTYQRSNELIQLAYKGFHKRFTIIGCGGVFSAQEAYTKITLGASLIQLITGMIFQGPQLITQINLELMKKLKKDGFTTITQAVGVYT